MNAPDPARLVDVAGLTVCADGRPILSGASLHVGAGEVVGLVGVSGAGKSTVAGTLLGHLRPGLRREAGTVRVAGLDPFHPVEQRRLRVGLVSYLGQDPALELDPAWCIGAQLRARVRQQRRRPTTEDVAQLLLRLGLDPDTARRHPHQLSGGQLRRAAFALAVINRPRLLVLDEPTSGLDSGSAALLAGLVRERDPDCSVLLITHDHSVLAGLADRVLEVADGRLHQAGVVSRQTPLPRRDGSRTPAVLHAARISAAHRGRLRLAPLDLLLRPGTTTAVVGPSGAGKSTLARVLVGLHPRAGGSLQLHGRPLPCALHARSTAQRRAIQLVPQDASGSLNPAETVGRTLRRALAAAGRSGTTAAVAELLATVRLGQEMLPRRAGELSGGERQRVAVARALACRPAVLICDEITSALDAATATSVLESVDALRAKGTAVVLITHDRHEVARWAHRTLQITQP